MLANSHGCDDAIATASHAALELLKCRRSCGHVSLPGSGTACTRANPESCCLCPAGIIKTAHVDISPFGHAICHSLSWLELRANLHEGFLLP